MSDTIKFVFFVGCWLIAIVAYAMGMFSIANHATVVETIALMTLTMVGLHADFT